MSARKKQTAGSLAADWWWESKYHARIKGGQKLWQAVSRNHGRKTVRLSRLDNEQCRAFIVYVDPETPMELVRQ